MTTIHDWGKGIGFGPVVDLYIRFTAWENRQAFIKWATGMQLPQYRIYNGPFHPRKHPDRVICKYFYDKTFDKLASYESGEIEGLSYGGTFHSIDIYDCEIWFYRTWGSTECSESDLAVLNDILKKDFHITQWGIYDEWYGPFTEGYDSHSLLKHLRPDD